MKKAKKISFLLIFTFALQTVVFATDVKFVRRKKMQNQNSAYSVYLKRKKSPKTTKRTT